MCQCAYLCVCVRADEGGGAWVNVLVCLCNMKTLIVEGVLGTLTESTARDIV